MWLISQPNFVTQDPLTYGKKMNFVQLKGSVKELNKFHNYETEKITRKASDAAEYVKMFGSSARDRHAWRI